MSGKSRKSKPRKLPRAVQGGLSRLRKKTDRPAPPAANNGLPLSQGDSLPHQIGILRPGTSELRLPAALAEAGETDTDGEQNWRPGPVVLTVTIVALLFIAVITWFVSRMPAP